MMGGMAAGTLILWLLVVIVLVLLICLLGEKDSAVSPPSIT
jgi:uncharacterized membrane protein